jgi:hypothetical protein
MNHYAWLFVRLLIIGVWFSWGIASHMSTPSMPPFIYGIALLWGAVVVRFWVVRSYTSKNRHTPWLLPSWTANPFALEQPFQFFHVVGLSFLAFALASIIGSHSSLGTADPSAVPGALIAGAFGLGILCGIYWALWSYRVRFRSQQSVA